MTTQPETSEIRANEQTQQPQEEYKQGGLFNKIKKAMFEPDTPDL